MGWVLLATVIVSIMGGLLIGRWVALIVPAVLIPLFYTGLRLGRSRGSIPTAPSRAGWTGGD